MEFDISLNDIILIFHLRLFSQTRKTNEEKNKEGSKNINKNSNSRI